MESTVEQIIKGSREKKSLQVTGLEDAAAAFILSLVYKKLQQPLLLITPTGPAAVNLRLDLGYFLNGGPVRLIPAYETLPFEKEAPSPEMTAARLAALFSLARGDLGLYVIPASLLTNSFMPASLLRESGVHIRPGQKLDFEELTRRLSLYGYRRVDLVESPGEYSLRGSIMDIYAPGWENPMRLDFFGDNLEEMRWFSPIDQRSLLAAEEACLIPFSEIIAADAAETFRERVGDFSPDFKVNSSKLGRLCRELEDQGPQARQISLLPLFYPKPETIFDFCTPDTMVVIINPDEVFFQARACVEETIRRGREEGYDDLFLKRYSEETAAGLDRAEKGDLGEWPVLSLSALPREEPGDGLFLKAISVSEKLRGGPRPRRSSGWPALDQAKEWQKDSHVVFVCRSGGSARRLTNIMKGHDVGAKLMEDSPFDPSWLSGEDRSFIVHTGELTGGFRMPGFGITFITEEDLFGPKFRLQERRRRGKGLFDLDFASLSAGDYLVHEDHGIGKYSGVARIKINSQKEDMLTLSYADGGRLYLPMDRLYLVQKYIFQKGHQPRMDRLGGKAWSRAKARARRAARKMVRDMLRLQARRQLQEGHSFGTDGPWQREFEASFGYEETEDQWRCIEEVKRDMESSRPMDRLVVGDVGYGKTEVAMRAAFKAVNDGKQAALLAPTTILCQQHHLNFHNRLAPFPVKLEVLSRFTSAGGQKRIVAGLADGTVDMVIGTHRLLSEDITFKELGLLIIDEEHRFGVRHKEKLKKMRSHVDVLTLSATPIPRTFYMAMSSLRDLSIMETPPENRLAVRTRVVPMSNKIIKEAIQREMARGGQVFFLHNRVRSIEKMARHLHAVAPEARLAVAHGQMSEKSLERIMSDFVAGEYDVLVCTTIIQSGLDIPRANTMIINQAERFGLADLYQLRGRIGRSAHQAYAYLMLPAGRVTKAAGQRLKAIEEFSELGSGLKIASLDLEIRGAGNLLGYEQSGQMAEVGLEMYTRILEETVSELKGESAPPKKAISQPEIRTPYSAFIPEDYIGDVNQRLTIYKRLSMAEDEETLTRIADELKDIFGRPPREVEVLLNVAALKVAASWAGVVKLILTAHRAEIIFSPSAPVDSAKVVKLIQDGQGSVRMRGGEGLEVSLPGKDDRSILDYLKNLLLDLCYYDNVPPTPKQL
jgi:transcription-repair coupling factor (superfamily II helicase)